MATDGKALVTLAVPTALKQAIENAATAKKQTIAEFCRSSLAAAIGYKGELGAGGTRKVYANEAERKAAQKAKRQEKAALMKQLLAEHERKQAATAPSK